MYDTDKNNPVITVVMQTNQYKNFISVASNDFKRWWYIYSFNWERVSLCIKDPLVQGNNIVVAEQ